MSFETNPQSFRTFVTEWKSVSSDSRVKVQKYVFEVFLVQRAEKKSSKLWMKNWKLLKKKKIVSRHKSGVFSLRNECKAECAAARQQQPPSHLGEKVKISWWMWKMLWGVSRLLGRQGKSSHVFLKVEKTLDFPILLWILSSLVVVSCTTIYEKWGEYDEVKKKKVGFLPPRSRKSFSVIM